MGIAIFLLFLAAVISVGLKKASKPSLPDFWPLEACKPLSDPEQVLYFRLLSALPEHVVLAQVQLSRLMSVKRVPKRQSWLNRIDRKSADFVVCRRDFSVAAVIELDDVTHSRPGRVKADGDKDQALRSAGIEVLRWNVKAMPDEAAIRQALMEKTS